MKSVEIEAIKELMRTTGGDEKLVRSVLAKGYANEAIFEIIWSLNHGYTEDALREIVEVLSYLVNRG